MRNKIIILIVTLQKNPHTVHRSAAQAGSSIYELRKPEVYLHWSHMKICVLWRSVKVYACAKVLLQWHTDQEIREKEKRRTREREEGAGEGREIRVLTGERVVRKDK